MVSPKACDIYSVPYNGGMGGTAVAVRGRAILGLRVYPTFSADDKYLAYNRVASVGGKPITIGKTANSPSAKADGTGDAIRLKAKTIRRCSW